MIAIAVTDDTARIALLRNGIVSEYGIWRFNIPGDIGDRFMAQVVARAPALAGSFVELGGTTGFLPDSAGSGLTEGSYFLAEVTRCAQGGKGPRVKAVGIAAAAKPGPIGQGLGPLRALAERSPAAPIIVDDYAMIALLRARSRAAGLMLESRISHGRRVFDPAMEDEIDQLSQPVAHLPDGARMHITPAPALTAIDIDSGGAGVGGTKSHGQLALNLKSIPEIGRQIVLRNLSGALLIDFAGMKSSARPKLAPALRQALTADPLSPRLHGFTELGFAEISRPRIRPPLHEFLQ